MKKITLLLSLAFLAFSCSDDDDSTSSISTADLVGQWTLISSSEAVELDECEDMDTIVFSDTQVVSTYYYFNGTECVLDYVDTDEYTLNDNTITVVYEYDENEDGVISEDEMVEVNVGVSISGSELTISYSETDEDGETYSESNVYTKN